MSSVVMFRIVQGQARHWTRAPGVSPPPCSDMGSEEHGSATRIFFIGGSTVSELMRSIV